MFKTHKPNVEAKVLPNGTIIIYNDNKPTSIEFDNMFIKVIDNGYIAITKNNKIYKIENGHMTNYIEDDNEWLN